MSEPQFLSTDPQAGLPKAPPPPAPPAAVLPDVTKHAGVPVAGRGTQFDPEQAQRAAKSAYDTATTPLAHPTGVDAIDAMTSPIGLASLAAGGAGILRAGVSGGVLAAGKAALADAAPLVKYEATKTILEKMGAPSSMATVAAMAVSGYKRGAKQAAAEAAPAAAAGTTLSAAEEAALYKQGYSPATVEKIKAAARQSAAMPASAVPASPVASPPVAAAVPASPVPSTGAQSPTVESLPSARSPQQMLNEEALARRRAEYQARQAAAPPPEPPAPAKAKLFASEGPEYMRLIKAGKTHQQAMDVIEANRLLQERLGLKTPTAEETRFPKGQRGKKIDPQ